jgi:hypothetical protein
MPAGASRPADTSAADLAGVMRPPLAEIPVELPPPPPAGVQAAAPARTASPAANEPSRRADGRGGVGGAATGAGVLRGAVGDAFASGTREERASADQGAVRRVVPAPAPSAPPPAPPQPTVATAAAETRLSRNELSATLPPVALADSTIRVPMSHQAAKLGSVVAATGTITGKVVTTDNAPLGLASVFVQPTGVGTTTRADGTFTLPPLPPGRYTIEARRIGYEVARLDGVQLASGDTAHANLALSASALHLSEVVVTGAMTMPKVGSACFSLDVSEGADAAGIPLLPRRVSFRVAEAPLDSDQDVAKARADRFAAPGPLSQRRALTRSASEPAMPLPWRAIAQDSIEVMWPTESEVVTLRLQLRESGLRGTRVQGTATSSGTPPRTATVSGAQIVCGGG